MALFLLLIILLNEQLSIFLAILEQRMHELHQMADNFRNLLDFNKILRTNLWNMYVSIWNYKKKNRFFLSHKLKLETLLSSILVLLWMNFITVMAVRYLRVCIDA